MDRGERRKRTENVCSRRLLLYNAFVNPYWIENGAFRLRSSGISERVINNYIERSTRREKKIKGMFKNFFCGIYKDRDYAIRGLLNKMKQANTTFAEYLDDIGMVHNFYPRRNRKSRNGKIK